MLRELNTNILIDLRITAHQYIIAMLLLDKQYDHLEKYLNDTNSYNSFEQDLKNLAARTFVRYNPSNIYSFNSIVVLPPFMKEMGKYDGFEELYNTYPNTVRRPDGKIDYLRRDKPFCKQVYHLIVKDNKHTHDHIIDMLRKELEYKRKQPNGFAYMKRLSKWLSEREWENYETLLVNSSPYDYTQLNTGEERYGEGIE